MLYKEGVLKALACGIWVFLLIGTLPAAPSRERVPGEGFNLLSEKEEIELGRAAAAQVEKDLVLLNDPRLLQYVTSLGQSLVAASQRNNIPYTFRVVNTDEVNAFALPGGFIYVHRGVLDRADSEAEVAGVLAHEIGHVVARHSAKQVSKSMLAELGISALDVLWGGKNSTSKNITQLAATLVAQGTFLKFSRDAEREADRLGAREMYDAGYNPRGMLTFFEKLHDLQKRDPGKVELFFASHPSIQERIENVAQELDSFPSKRWVPARRDFTELKAYLHTLPPPPQKARPK